MTPEAWALVGVAVAVLAAGLIIAAAVRQAGVRVHHAVHETGRHQGEAMAFVKGVVLDMSPAVKELNRDLTSATRRTAVAAEKIADDTPAQKTAKKYQDMSEALLVGINTVLEREITHPEGLREDVIIGRDQGVELLKDTLRAELANAMK